MGASVYSRVANHRSMVFDDQRNEAYSAALHRLVRPDTVVLDLGAGLGLHGLLAAKAGAARVYLVEPEPVLQVAMQAAHANGLQDRVRALRGRIEEVTLPEPVDLIVSVFTGNLLFSEDLLPSLYHARDRWLRPGGRLLPGRAQLWLAPLEAPQLHRDYVARWSDPVVGLDYAAGRQHAANEILWLEQKQFDGTRRLAEGVPSVDLDFHTALQADCQATARCVAQQEGLCHGLLGWIRVELDGSWLSTAPDAPEVHWRPVLLPLDPPLPLAAGDELTMQLHRPRGGDWTWSVQAPQGARRHSTFLAGAEGLAELRRVAPGTSPGLNARGHAALAALQQLHRGHTNAEAAAHLTQTEGVEPAEALRIVQGLAARYGTT